MKSILLSFTLCLSLNLFSQPLSTEEVKILDSLLMVDIPDGAPGGAIGVIRNGEIVYEHYAGLADLESGRTIDERTRFNLASNGKQFTALAILLLAEQSLLNMEDDIRKYLPELYPNISKPITIQNLLTHTSGIREASTLWAFQGKIWWKHSFNNKDVRQILSAQNDLNFEPGSEKSYCNSNYLLLTEIVEVVSGQSFQEFSDQMFAQLGMNATNFLSNHEDDVPNLARPYFNFDTWTTYEWLSDLHGDGALFSTLGDQLRWELIIQQAIPDQLSANTLEESQNPILAVTDYGYGLEGTEYAETPIRFHEGSTGAWKASFRRFPTKNLSIVVVNNSGKFGTSTLANKVANVLLELPEINPAYELGPSPEMELLNPEECLGTYLTGAYYFRFVELDSQLYLQRPGRPDISIATEGDGVFYEVTDPDFKMAFHENEEGQRVVTAYYPTHHSFDLIETVEDYSHITPEQIVGTYYNDEIGASIPVSHIGESTYQFDLFGESIEGDLLTPNMIGVDGDEIELIFSEDSDKRVVEMLYHSGRVRNLRFKRQ
ncbi:MAG: serine hydrolase domain-containing protein, partial [Bacteroidota bacterium]